MSGFSVFERKGGTTTRSAMYDTLPERHREPDIRLEVRSGVSPETLQAALAEWLANFRIWSQGQANIARERQRIVRPEGDGS